MKNCILYLTGNRPQDVEDLKKSLAMLKTNYWNQYPCDILIFHENGFQPWEEAGVKWIPIQFTLPDIEGVPEYFPHPTHGNGPIAWGHPGFSIGYRHMCWFFAGGMYRQPALQEHTYYLRLDTDSFILKPVGYDIFKRAAENNIYYGFIKDAVQKDNPKVIEDLWKSAYEYFSNVQPVEEGMMYYTNFELGHIQWFLNSGYMYLFNHLEKQGGIYTKRWGDAPIKYIGVNAVIREENKWAITDIAYQHGAVYNV